MKTVSSLNQELVELETIRDMVTVYQELAANLVKDQKDEILKRRPFMDGLRELYSVVRLAKTGVTDKPKTADVFLSANTRLFGSIISDTFEIYTQSLRNSKSDSIVLGTLGVHMFENRFQKQPNHVLELPENPPFEGLDELISLLDQYDVVTVYHGVFANLASQQPTQVPILSPEPDNTTHPAKTYLFEPSLETLHDLFKRELIVSVMQHALYEANLAKQAARVLQLDAAIDNVADQSNKTQHQKRRLEHQLQSKKQQARLVRVIKS